MCAQVYTMVQVSTRLGSHKSDKRAGVDLLMVNSHRKCTTGDEGLAFARVGFSAHDRVGYQRRATIGYGGGIDLVDRIANAIPDHADVS